MSQQVQGLFTIHRLRTGKTIQLYLDVVGGLYQSVNTSGVCTPNWEEPDNRPTITPNIKGDGVVMVDPRWYKDLPSNIPSSGRGPYEAKDGDGVHSIGSNGSLTFVSTPVDRHNIHNITYTFICRVSTGGNEEEIQRTIQIICRQGGENSYWGQILAPQGTTLGEVINASGLVEEKKSTELTPRLIQGENAVDGYTVKWFKTGAGEGGADLEIKNDESVPGCTLNGKNLIVNRDAVDSMAHFECHFFVNSVFVEAEGIQITDNADEYFINTPGNAFVFTGSGDEFRAVLGLYRRSSNEFVKVEKEDAWSVVVTDSERMYELEHGFSIEPGVVEGEVGRGIFRISESYMYVPNKGADKATKPWLKCGDRAADDVPVARIEDATPCGVNVSVTVRP